MCVFIKEGKECVLKSRETWPFYLMCRDPRPETRGTPAGTGELLRGWQHLRRHRGPRGQLQAQHARPQRRLRYKSVFILLYVGRFSHFIFFVYLYFKQKDPQKAEIFYNQDKETPIYVYIYFLTMLSHQVIDGQCEFSWFGVGYSSFPAHPLDTDTFELVSHINEAVVCSQENVSWDPQDG